MMNLKRFSFMLALVLFALAAGVRAQTPAADTVNVTAAPDKVHFSIGGDLFETRVEAANEAGEVVYESGILSGDSFDWGMTDSRGGLLPAGDYTLTITYRTPAGKLLRRTEQVTVPGQGQKAQESSAGPTPAAIATITGQGTVGKISKFTGINSIANSVLTESANRVGVGIAPTHSLTIAATGPLWTSNQWRGAVALPFASAIAWAKQPNTPYYGFGMGHTTSGFYMFRTSSAPGTTPYPAIYDLTINNAGSVGIGTTAVAGIKLDVLGVAAIRPTGPGKEIVFGTPAAETGMTIKYVSTGRADLRFDGQTLKLVAGADTGPPPATNGLVITKAGRVGVGTINPQSGKLHVEGGVSTGVYGHSSSDAGVVGESEAANGVVGSSHNINFGGIVGENTAGGYGGIFFGKVKVNGALQVSSCTGCTISSDRNLKANVSSINPRVVLDRLAALPIRQWSYKDDEPVIRHMGPMAQDFRAAFNLGADDKHIDMVDANGVTMASVQALYQLMLEKDRQNQELNRKVERLERQLEQQQAQLDQVRRAVRRRAARR